MLLLECPRCHNRMMYQQQDKAGDDVSGKSKKCVYCNFSFGVQKCIVQKV